MCEKQRVRVAILRIMHGGGSLWLGLLMFSVGLDGSSSTPDFDVVSVAANLRSDTVLVDFWSGDQRPELLIVNQSSEAFPQGAVHLLRHDGIQWETPTRLLAGVTNFAPTTGIAADFNGDGFPDLLADNTVIGQESLILFLNNASEPGQFSAGLSLPFGFGMVAVDLNGDDFPDLVHLDSEFQSDPDALLGKLYVYFNKGRANGVWQGFESPEIYDTTLDPGPDNPRSASHLAVADITGNGHPDIVTDTLVLLNGGESGLDPVMPGDVLAEAPLLLTEFRESGRVQLVQGRLEAGNALSPREATLEFFEWSGENNEWASAGPSFALGSVTAFNLVAAAADVSQNRRTDLVVSAGSHLFFLTGDGSGEGLSFAKTELARHYLTDANNTLVVAYSGAPRLADLNGDGTLDLVVPRGGTQIIPYGLIDVFSVTLAPVTIEVFTYFSESDEILSGNEALKAGVSGVLFALTGPASVINMRSGSEDLNEDGLIDMDQGEVGITRFRDLPAGPYELTLGELDERLQPVGDGQAVTVVFDALPGDTLRAEFGIGPSDSGFFYQGGLPDAVEIPALGEGPLHLPDLDQSIRLGATVVFAQADDWAGDYSNSTDGLARGGRDGVIFVGPPQVGETAIPMEVIINGAQSYLNVWLADAETGWSNEGWAVKNQLIEEPGVLLVEVEPDHRTFPLTFRTRISAVPLSYPTELTMGGETEDYQLRGFHFGSADSPYPVSRDGGGAVHPAIEALYLGAAAPEPELQWPVVGMDRPRNRRGVTVSGQLEPGGTGRLQVVGSGEGYLQGWIDFRQKRFWDPSEDVILLNQPFLGAGPEEAVELLFNVPFDAVAGITFARVRFSSMPDLGPDGPAFDGEVEDFAVQILSPRQGALRRLLVGDQSLGGGWLRSRWFGVFKVFGGGWIFHGELGFVFLGEAGAEGLFVYVDGLGWLYTREEVFPYFYAYAEDSFVFLNPERTYPDRWFYVFSPNNPGWRNLRQ